MRYIKFIIIIIIIIVSAVLTMELQDPRSIKLILFKWVFFVCRPD